MITGVGIDIEEIGRIEEIVKRWGTQFLNRIFTKQEQQYCEAKPCPAQHYAARFAAKEAFSKAIGTGWGEGFTWRDVEITNDDAGKPCIAVYNTLESTLEGAEVHVSISHSRSFVTSIVIIERNA